VEERWRTKCNAVVLALKFSALVFYMPQFPARTGRKQNSAYLNGNYCIFTFSPGRAGTEPVSFRRFCRRVGRFRAEWYLSGVQTTNQGTTDLMEKKKKGGKGRGKKPQKQNNKKQKKEDKKGKKRKNVKQRIFSPPPERKKKKSIRRDLANGKATRTRTVAPEISRLMSRPRLNVMA